MYQYTRAQLMALRPRVARGVGDSDIGEGSVPDGTDAINAAALWAGAGMGEAGWGARGASADVGGLDEDSAQWCVDGTSWHEPNFARGVHVGSTWHGAPGSAASSAPPEPTGAAAAGEGATTASGGDALGLSVALEADDERVGRGAGASALGDAAGGEHEPAVTPEPLPPPLQWSLQDLAVPACRHPQLPSSVHLPDATAGREEGAQRSASGGEEAGAVDAGQDDPPLLAAGDGGAGHSPEELQPVAAHDLMHAGLCAYADEIQKGFRRQLPMRNELVARLGESVRSLWPTSSLKVYGSCSAMLASSESDLDLVVCDWLPAAMLEACRTHAASRSLQVECVHRLASELRAIAAGATRGRSTRPGSAAASTREMAQGEGAEHRPATSRDPGAGTGAASGAGVGGEESRKEAARWILEVSAMTSTVPIVSLTCRLDCLAKRAEEEGVDGEGGSGGGAGYAGAHGETLVNVDISFYAPGHHGLRTMAVMRQLVSATPPLVPLVLFVKQLLKREGLNRPFTGGLSSYGLVIMCQRILRDEYRALADEAADKLVLESQRAAAAAVVAPVAGAGPGMSLGSMEEGEEERASDEEAATPSQADLSMALPAVARGGDLAAPPPAACQPSPALSAVSGMSLSVAGSPLLTSAAGVGATVPPALAAAQLNFQRLAAAATGVPQLLPSAPTAAPPPAHLLSLTNLGCVIARFLWRFSERNFCPEHEGVSINDGVTGSGLHLGHLGGWIRRRASPHLDHFRCDSLVLLDPAHADNNIGRNCYRIGQIQRTFSNALEKLEREGRKARERMGTRAPAAPAAAAGAVSPSPDTVGAGRGGAEPSARAAAGANRIADLRAAGLALVRSMLAHPEPPSAHGANAEGGGPGAAVRAGGASRSFTGADAVAPAGEVAVSGAGGAGTAGVEVRAHARTLDGEGTSPQHAADVGAAPAPGGAGGVRRGGTATTGGVREGANASPPRPGPGGGGGGRSPHKTTLARPAAALRGAPPPRESTPTADGSPPAASAAPAGTAPATDGEACTSHPTHNGGAAGAAAGLGGGGPNMVLARGDADGDGADAASRPAPARHAPSGDDSSPPSSNEAAFATGRSDTATGTAVETDEVASR